MSKSKNIIFTGGGSGGHVVPALTIINKLKDQFNILYIGSHTGIESKLTEGHVDKYYSISTGKLRRYISIENIIDIFKVGLGLIQAFFLLLRLRASSKVIVSMGGFVCVPVVLAARLLGYKIIIHEQTTRVGLANKICSKVAQKVFVSFEDSKKFFPASKVELSGYPIRDRFLTNELNAKSIEGISLVEKKKPIVFITGGGNGAKLLNDKILENLSDLKEKYTVIHQVGAKFFDEFKSLKDDSYLPLAFIGEEMPDIFKASDIVISRSGAGTVAELMTLKKKSIYIPLKIAQKNEQYHNAMEASKYVGSLVIEEDDFNQRSVLDIIDEFNTVEKLKSSYEFKNDAIDIIKNEVLKSY